MDVPSPALLRRQTPASDEDACGLRPLDWDALRARLAAQRQVNFARQETANRSRESCFHPAASKMRDRRNEREG